MANKKRSFIRKLMTGIKCHPDEILRMFVLTESDLALEKGYDFVLKFKHLVAYLRKRYGKFEYCCVLHRQGDKKRLNYHVIYFGRYIPQDVINDWWVKNYDSVRSKMEVIKNPLQAARYVAGYMDRKEKYVGSRFSNGWVFPGWWDFAYWMKKNFGSYPTDEMLIAYARMTEVQLWHDKWYGLYVDEKIKAGKLKPRIGGVKRGKKLRVFEKVLKPDEYEILSGQLCKGSESSSPFESNVKIEQLLKSTF
jgi:hypothetical protein